MLHSVSELAGEQVVRKPVEAWGIEQEKVQYCLAVMRRMQRYSIKINRSSRGWLSMTVCEHEAG